MALGHFHFQKDKKGPEMKNIASRKKNSKPLLIEGTFRDERPDLFNDRTLQKCASGLDASWSKMKHILMVCM